MKITKIFMAWALFLGCALGAGAFPVESDERIIQDGNEHAFMNFPSAYVGPRHVRFVLPEDYGKSAKRYGVVYVLGEEKHKNIVKAKDVIYVFITPQAADNNTGKFVKFLETELILYTDNNYSTLNEPRYRLLAARSYNAVNAAEVYAAQKKISNMALLNITGFDAGFKPKGKIWLTGAERDINEVNGDLLKNGFKYAHNMLYSFDTQGKFDEIPFSMVFGSQVYSKEFKVKLSSDYKAAPYSLEEGIGLTAALTFKNGVKANYLIEPQDIFFYPALAPVIAEWDAQEQAIRLARHYAVTEQKQRTLAPEINVLGKKARTKIKLY